VFWGVVIFSAVFNILMLAGPLYMLQVYDRVLASRSVPTLIGLTALLVFAYAFQAILDLLRSRVVVRAATLLDYHLATSVHGAAIRIALQNRPPAEAHQPLADLDKVRNFLTGAGPMAMIDLPWIPVYLLVCGLIHPWLGEASLCCALLLMGLTLMTERASRGPTRELLSTSGQRMAMLEIDRRNSESAVAMGMTGTLADRWTTLNARYLKAISRSADIAGSYGGVMRVIRLFMQSLILGLGAYLVIQQELTPGSMVAASIMMGRALAPIDVVIANWRPFVDARTGLRRLSEVLGRLQKNAIATRLPRPESNLRITGGIVAVPATQRVIVSNINFQLKSGEAMGVVGPSGSGKSSLARTLTGVWPLFGGRITLDGADIDQWDRERLGPHVGYLSQQVELFAGTVAENIARMAIEPDSEAVIRAARAAGAHDLIVQLPAGYDTHIGDGGVVLSGGQRQRVALARALYGDPFLIVLDEPNASLDMEGEVALQRAIGALKARQAIVILITHRGSVLTACDTVLHVAGGMQRLFGPRDQVLQSIMRGAVPVPSHANLKVVGEPATTGTAL